MNESRPDLTPDSPQPPATSLTSRLTDVFISPSDVFNGVKAGPPSPANWIAPLVAATIMGIIYALVIFSQPAILQTIKDVQERKFQENQELVAKGKMTQQQADSVREMAEKFMTPPILKAAGILSAVIGNLIVLFATAGILWLLGRYAFHADFGYMQSVEATGLTLMIAVLSGIIKMLLDVIYGNTFMNVGPVLLLGHFDPANKVHLLLAAFNVMSLWYIAVLAIGLARLSGTRFWKAAVWLFGLWAIVALGPIWLLPKK